VKCVDNFCIKFVQYDNPSEKSVAYTATVMSLQLCCEWHQNWWHFWILKFHRWNGSLLFTVHKTLPWESNGEKNCKSVHTCQSYDEISSVLFFDSQYSQCSSV